MIRILDSAAVDDLLTEDKAVEAMRDLFSLAATPGAVGLARVDLVHPRGWLRSLPGFITPLGIMGFKVLHRTNGVGMRYTIYVHDLETGELTGLVDGLEVTNLRTGAVAAVATDHLAVGTVEVAAVIGTGPVARGQLRVLDRVRPASETRVFARTPENRTRFVAEMSGHVKGELVASASLEEAVEGADLVTLATKATEPILFERHVAPGMHVNSVGPASRDRMEIDPALFPAFDRVVCDSVDLVMDEAGDAVRAVEEGHFHPATADDLAMVVSGETPGRESPDQVTLFKSVGTGLQDLMVAGRLLIEAAAMETGRLMDSFVSVKPLGG